MCMGDKIVVVGRAVEELKILFRSAYHARAADEVASFDMCNPRSRRRRLPARLDAVDVIIRQSHYAPYLHGLGTVGVNSCSA